MSNKSKKTRQLNYLPGDMFFTLLGIFTIIPFIIISFFDNPAIDDFYFANHCHTLGFWASQADLYKKWNGRYFSNALLSANPSLLFMQFFVYKLIPVILLIILFLSIYYLVKLVFVNSEKKNILLPTGFIFIIYMFQMPSTAQGIYWLPGSITYQVGNVFAILLFCCIIKLVRTREINFLFLSVLLAFCAIGCNETIMEFTVFLLASILVLNSGKQKKINYSLLLVFVFAILFSVVVIIAPGNNVRETFFPFKHQFGHSVFNSIAAIFYYFIKWLPLLSVFTLLLFNDLKKYVTCDNSFFNVNPFVVLVICCIIPVIGFFPSYWSTNFASARTVNAIYLIFIIEFLYAVFYIFYFLRKKGVNVFNISTWVRYVMCVLIIISFFGKNNVNDAYSDLLNGSVYNYNKELNDRYYLITHSQNDTCFVPELKYHPVTLFVDDIQDSSSDWRNSCYDAYWHRTIKIKKLPP